MADSTCLDGLLGDEESHATFHDAVLLWLTVDEEKRELVSEWQLCVGDPADRDREARERRRRGLLTLCKLHFWVVEPVGVGDELGCAGWLTADGPLEDARTEMGRRLARDLPVGSVGWYLYFADLNAFAYCGAEEARFEWR